MDVEKLAEVALEEAQRLGATYADVRYEEITEQGLSITDGKPELINQTYSKGLAVRVIANGAWGFAADSLVNEDRLPILAAQAVEIAKASATINQAPIELAPSAKAIDHYVTPMKKDPFAVSLTEKLNLLMELEQLLKSDPQINSTSLFMHFARTSKFFASLEGSRITQDIYQSGCGATCGAIKSQRERTERSYPSTEGQWIAGGYEVLDQVDFNTGLPKAAAEVIELLSAQPCPQKEMDLVLASDLVSLQIHESIGHTLELDRVFGYERNFSGVSFATPEKLGQLKIASDIITFISDPTYPGGLATYAYDDEGTKGQSNMLVDKGLLVNYLSDRETAARIGKNSTGCSRAAGWNNVPLVRIPNLLLQPGNQTLDEIISGVEEGIFIATPSSWSIDDNRENFTLAGEIGWEIKGGKWGAMLKSPRYSGSTVSFWNSCDAIGNRESWILWGTPNCGKGQPGQNARTAQGAAPCRFRKVKIG